MDDELEAEMAAVFRDVVALTTAVDGDDMDAAWSLIGSFTPTRMRLVLVYMAGTLGVALGLLDLDSPPEVPPALMELGLAWAERGVA